MEEPVYSAAWHEGYRSYVNDLWMWENPYLIISEGSLFTDWIRGWIVADSEYLMGKF